MSGISMLFYLSGLQDTNPLIDLLINAETITQTGLNIAFIGGLSLLVGIITGYLLRDPWFGVTVGVIVAALPLLWNFISIFTFFQRESPVFAYLILAPIYLLFIFTMFDYARKY
jgi:hypothetical protein